jgi:CBS domain-containing protein
MKKGIKIDSIKRQVYINGKPVSLSSIQFCYYYYFAHRAKIGKQFLLFTGPYTPQEFSSTVYQLHQQIFPEAVKYREEMYETMVKGQPVNLSSTARAHISKLNKKIKISAFKIANIGKKNASAYGINCSAKLINITTTTVIPTFERSVHVFTLDDTLEEVLRFMKKYQYSQVVVRNKHRLHLITPESILDWLQKEAVRKKKVINISDILLLNLNYDNDSTFLSFYDAARTVDEARSEFYERFNKDAPRLSAIIITSTGTSTGTPIGIITPWDFIYKKYW